ncbi:MAG: RNA polymerase sigma factor [Candidatus Aminicenantes bacterium]|nr:RNA polymerase sigma factor [Candidatus Aminicenantes bacterium]
MDEKEAALVDMVLAGDAGAFEPLVRPYRNDLLRLALRMTGNREDADEASQEALIRAFRYLSRFDKTRSFKNWLLGILVNEARTIRRGAPRAVSLEDAAEPSLPADQERRHEQGVFRDRLRACLAGLSRGQREVFILRDLEERNIRETAAILGVSELSVRVHLSRARKRIKALMVRAEATAPVKEATP